MSNAWSMVRCLTQAPLQQFEINVFQMPGLNTLIKLLRDRVRATARDPREKTGILRRIKQRAGQLFMIVLGHEHAAYAVLDGFRDSAMLGRKNGKPARHCFQH